MKKLYIKTFGCQMNEYDSEKMADVLHANDGMTTTNDPTEADVILLNTCSIREKAEDKVFSDLGRLRELKKLKPELLIGVGGCVASQEGQQIISRAPYVDVVFGGSHAIVGMQDIGHLFRVVLVHLTAKGFDIQFFHMPFQVYNWGRLTILREIYGKSAPRKQKRQRLPVR